MIYSSYLPPTSFYGFKNGEYDGKEKRCMVAGRLKNFSNFIDTGIIHDDVHVAQFKALQYRRHLVYEHQNVTEICPINNQKMNRVYI